MSKNKTPFTLISAVETAGVVLRCKAVNINAQVLRGFSGLRGGNEFKPYVDLHEYLLMLRISIGGTICDKGREKVKD